MTTAIGRLRSWIVYLAITGLASVLLLEGAVRLLALAPPLPAQYSKNVADPYLPWKPQPLSVVEGRTPEFAYSYRHNRAGFRDAERDTRKPPGTFRILALGDSFTYGVGVAVEETYGARLEAIMNAALGGRPRVEVINAGVPRFWPEPERLLLEYYGLAYEPDLVLVGFLPNDVIDTHVGINGVEVSGGFLVTRHLDPLGGAGSWLYRHSHAFRALFVPYLVRRIESENARVLAADASEIFRANGAHETDWQMVEAEYGRMAALARRAGAGFAAIYIAPKDPWPPSTHPYPQQRLAAWAEARQVGFVDTSGALTAAAARAAVHYPQDQHCTAAGHEAIAQAIAAVLFDSPLQLAPRPAR